MGKIINYILTSIKPFIKLKKKLLKVVQSTVQLYHALAADTKGKAKYGLVTN